MEKRIWWLDDDKTGISDPGYVAFCLNSYIDAAYPMQTYLDVLHLAGRTYPIAEALNFNPVAWIRAYEATGGMVGEMSSALIIAYSSPSMTPTALASSMGFKSLSALCRWRRAHEDHAWRKALLGHDEIYWTDGDAYAFVIKLEPLKRRRKQET